MEDEVNRAAKARKGSLFLNTAQAAFYIGLSHRTLEKMRLTGGGPRFRKHGRYVRYHIDDLDAWSLGERRDSTSDKGDAS
ncbi:helix-turn-helix transcriptional regulator [Niveispirillum cyanobacteriorum]|uniref:DNA-binding protein n=1 Tax=Niveispirillum cyanobacteriorum TaxID=1612173 RepID=A0A2K9NI36_9PROT|nr:helix-turn-helix domain-containing protein [Niveispirillum cyanobacteriorum]AUN32733.1 DNA-binding protein [Niveispirillum cyanobacteriorum]GGE83728.1 DNA-binding protein [Niveispirillum cyanobacteriorum]